MKSWNHRQGHHSVPISNCTWDGGGALPFWTAVLLMAVWGRRFQDLNSTIVKEQWHVSMSLVCGVRLVSMVCDLVGTHRWSCSIVPSICISLGIGDCRLGMCFSEKLSHDLCMTHTAGMVCQWWRQRLVWFVGCFILDGKFLDRAVSVGYSITLTHHIVHRLWSAGASLELSVG